MHECPCCRSHPGTPQTSTLWVESDLLDCCNHAYEIAASHHSADVEISHFLIAALAHPNARAVLDAHSVPVRDLLAWLKAEQLDIPPAQFASLDFPPPDTSNPNTGRELRHLLFASDAAVRKDGRDRMTLADTLGTFLGDPGAYTRARYALLLQHASWSLTARRRAAPAPRPEHRLAHGVTPSSTARFAVLDRNAPLRAGHPSNARNDNAAPYHTPRPELEPEHDLIPHHQSAPTEQPASPELTQLMRRIDQQQAAILALAETLLDLSRARERTEHHLTTLAARITDNPPHTHSRARRSTSPRAEDDKASATPDSAAPAARAPAAPPRSAQRQASTTRENATTAAATHTTIVDTQTTSRSSQPEPVPRATRNANTHTDTTTRRQRRLARRQRRRLTRIQRRHARITRRTSRRSSTRPYAGFKRYNPTHSRSSYTTTAPHVSHSENIQPAPFQDEDDIGVGKRFYLGIDDDIVCAPSIGPRTADRLIPHGLRKVRDLLACDPEDMASRIAYRHINADRIRDWQAQARLVCTVPWLRGTHAQLIVGSGYRTFNEIQATDGSTFCAAILRYATTRDGQNILRQGPPPQNERVLKWHEYATQAEPQRAA